MFILKYVNIRIGNWKHNSIDTTQKITYPFLSWYYYFSNNDNYY